MPLPDIELTVTLERHATHTRIRSFALGVQLVSATLLTLVPDPLTVASVLIATRYL
jgi:hypothetical protein